MMEGPMKITAARRGILTGRWRKASNGIRPYWSGDESHFLTHCTVATPVLMLVEKQRILQTRRGRLSER